MSSKRPDRPIAEAHPKSVRRRLLTILYKRYLEDPLDMLSPEDILAHGTVERADLVANMHYLSDRGLVELLTGYNPPLFAAARITADGIDIVENRYEFNLRFPPEPGQEEKDRAEIPVLVEQLLEEAEFSPVDGEERHALIRDIQFLRDEIARPAPRWRTQVIRTVLDWIEGHIRHCDEPLDAVLPTLSALRAALDTSESV